MQINAEQLYLIIGQKEVELARTRAAAQGLAQKNAELLHQVGVLKGALEAAQGGGEAPAGRSNEVGTEGASG